MACEVPRARMQFSKLFTLRARIKIVNTTHIRVRGKGTRSLGAETYFEVGINGRRDRVSTGKPVDT